MRAVRNVLLSLVSITCLLNLAWAAGPARGLPYSGTLELDGQPLQGQVAMTFTLLDADTGGTELWSETQNVSLVTGAFSVILGSVTALPLSVYEASEVYLEIAVDGTTLAGRKRMYPSFKAERAKTLQMPKDASQTSRIGFDAQASDPGEIAHVESPDNSGVLWLSSSDDWGASPSTTDFIAFGDRAADVRRHWFRSDGVAAISSRLAVGKTTAPANALEVAGTASVDALAVGGDTLRKFRATARQWAGVSLGYNESAWSKSEDKILTASGNAICFLQHQSTNLTATTLDDGTSLSCDVLDNGTNWILRASGSRGHHLETSISLTCEAACLTW